MNPVEWDKLYLCRCLPPTIRFTGRARPLCFRLRMPEVNPSLTPPQIRAILTSTAERLLNVPADRQGAGVINAAEALAAALQDR